MPERRTMAASNENYDLIETLHEKLQGVWRYDQFIQDSQEPEMKQMFEQIKQDDMRHAHMLEDAIKRRVQEGKWSAR